MLAAMPFLSACARWHMWQQALRRPAATQYGELMRLVRAAESTRFGRDHRFCEIKSVSDYQEQVPLRRYEDFWRDYWQADFPVLTHCTWPGKIPYFALTSGTTTGSSKYIPVSREMLHANLKAAWSILMFHLLNRPDSQVVGGKGLILGGSTDLHREADDVYSGDLSGIEANEVPWWAMPYSFPPRELAQLTDWGEKIDRIARLSLEHDIRAITGTPNWLLIFFDKLAELQPGAGPELVNYYPRLELLVHGGIDFKPYAKRFSELLAGNRAELREVYPASEAFIAIADRGPGQGLRLIVDHGVFYEFVPSGELDASCPTRHWLGNVEVGVDYAVTLSTCAGAWAYILGDTVKFVELDPPRIVITGRTSYVLSAFGEHLLDSEIELAVAAAADAIDAAVVDFSVAAEFPSGAGSKGRHHFVIEFVEQLPSYDRLAAFRDELDHQLDRQNADYRVHRAGGYGLQPPLIEAVAPGTFGSWMKSRGRLGGQHKVPRIINDRQLFDHLIRFLQQSRVPRRRWDGQAGAGR